jgi:Protein of unknown function (DUF3431)
MTRKRYIVYLIVLLLCSLLLTTLVSSYPKRTKYQEGFDGGGEAATTELVVARYNETLDWLRDEPYSKYPVKVYNKGANQDFTKTDRINGVFQLDNVGRCDHTYLYHVIHNYDSLADVTVFLPGSTDMPDKTELSKYVIGKVAETGDTYFPHDTYDVYDTFKDFKLDDWKASYAKNQEINGETELTPSKIRPFGSWYRAHFGDLKTTKYTYLGIFAVHKRHILQHPKSYYMDLIKELEVSSNPEVGHYFERAWGAVFGPIE